MEDGENGTRQQTRHGRLPPDLESAVPNVCKSPHPKNLTKQKQNFER